MRRRRLFGASLVGVLVLVILPAAPAAAITIGNCGSNADNVAALIAAFEEAEATPAGDTINLPAGCTFLFTESYGNTDFVLPEITTPITLNGQNSILEEDPNEPAVGGFFDVSPAGGLVVQDVALRNGGGCDGGFIRNAGFLLFVDSETSDIGPFGNCDSAIFNLAGGHLTLFDSSMRQHFLAGGRGGAINNAGNLFLVEATITRSNVRAPLGIEQVGGAIYNTGKIEMWDSTLSENDASLGGAIYNPSGEVYVTDSTFTDNQGNAGGAIASNSDLEVVGSYFARNEVAGHGGAIYNTQLAQVVNSTFKSNSARDGGAIANTRAIRIEHSTFGDNTGGALFTDEDSGFSSVEASILSGSGPQCEGDAPADFGDNIVWPSSTGCPAGFTLGNPQLGSPARNGGATLNLALGAASAAIDIAGACTDPDVDQRGKARPAGAGCDSGAFEDQLPGVPSTPVLSSGTNPNNTGEFTLDWSDATDPDGETPTYRLYRKDADDSDFSRIASPTSSHFVFDSLSPESEGTHRYRVESFDGNHGSVLLSQSGAVVVDKTAPTVPTALADRAPDFQPDGGNGWYVTPVTVTIGGSSDPLLGDSSAGTGVAAYTAPQTFTTSGLHTATGTATDAAGNVSFATTLDVQVDADPPVVVFDECPAEVILGSTASLRWTATDDHSGLATAPAGVIPIDTSAIGPQSLSTPVAADNVGLTAFATCNFNVVYDFDGFYEPITNAPTFNEVRAGQVIPISFSLNGDHGLDVIAPDFPASREIPCGDSPELTEGTPTMTSPQGLTFSPGRGGRYNYPWRTEREWGGTCRQFVLLLDDGTFHRANLIFY